MPGRRDARPTHRSRRRRPTAVSTWLPALLLVAGVGGSIGLAARLQAVGDERDRMKFRGAVRESTQAVGSELRRSEGVLRGLRGLFLSSAQVDEAEFHRYIGSLDLARGYPSVRGIVYVAAVPAGRLGAYAAAQRGRGRPGFRIRPAPASDPALLDAPVHRIVTFADPPGATSSRPGNDVTGRRPSRPAQDRSRDTGQVALTAKLDLVPGAARPQPGFSLLLPMY